MNVVEMLTEQECRDMLPRRYNHTYADEKEVIKCMMIAADAVAKKNTVAFNRGTEILKSLGLAKTRLPKVSKRLRVGVEAWRDSEKKGVEEDAMILLVDLVDALQSAEK